MFHIISDNMKLALQNIYLSLTIYFNSILILEYSSRKIWQSQKYRCVNKLYPLILLRRRVKSSLKIILPGETCN